MQKCSKLFFSVSTYIIQQNGPINITFGTIKNLTNSSFILYYFSHNIAFKNPINEFLNAILCEKFLFYGGEDEITPKTWSPFLILKYSNFYIYVFSSSIRQWVYIPWRVNAGLLKSNPRVVSK